MTAIPQETRSWPEVDGRESGSAWLRWSGAGLVILSLHAGTFWLASHWLDPPGAPRGAPEEAVMIELEPMAEAPSETVPAPAAQPAELDEPEPEVAEAPEPPPPEPDFTPEPHVEAPILPPETPVPLVPNAEAVLPPPPPPRPAQRKPAPPAKPAVAPKEERKKQRRPVAPARPRPSATAAAESRVAASSGSLSVSPAARANWQSQVAAHLNRFKRAPVDGATGVVRVSFRVNASGQVLSASLAGGSGSAALDQEAVSLVRRASPIPAPPPGMGSSVALVVPVRYTR